MKKHYLIYALLLLVATSCGKTEMEEIDTIEVPEALARINYSYNTLFHNIVRYSDGTSYEPWYNCMSGEIYSPEGGVYTMTFGGFSPDGDFFCELTSRAQLSCSTLFSNVSEKTFTAQLWPGITTFNLKINVYRPDAFAQARVVVNAINGKPVTSVNEGYMDLTVVARGVGDVQPPSTERYKQCDYDKCGTWSSVAHPGCANHGCPYYSWKGVGY